jgi:hypothetical protein
MRMHVDPDSRIRIRDFFMQTPDSHRVITVRYGHPPQDPVGLQTLYIIHSYQVHQFDIWQFPEICLRLLLLHDCLLDLVIGVAHHFLLHRRGEE